MLADPPRLAQFDKPTAPATTVPCPTSHWTLASRESCNVELRAWLGHSGVAFGSWGLLYKRGATDRDRAEPENRAMVASPATAA
jgi:hypothetical protein